MASPAQSRKGSSSQRGAGGPGAGDMAEGTEEEGKLSQKNAAQPTGETDIGDEEGVTSSEYNKWLVLEENWTMAEDTRKKYMEGSVFRKGRDERHRERGMERQATSIEQMKQAKGRVEDHRQNNLEKGKAVRNECAELNDARIKQRNKWVAQGREVKEAVLKMQRQRVERDALLALKKKLSLEVKKEVEQLNVDGKAQKDLVLSSHRSQATKIRAETSDAVIDKAKTHFYNQRKTAAAETLDKVKSWEAQRLENRIKFQEKSRAHMETSKKIEGAARLSRKYLQEQRAIDAREVRERKKQLQDSYRQQQEAHAALVKEVVNSSVNEKFAVPTNARQMLQHQHYQEVTAVMTDVTSQISKEIASSPRKQRPRLGGGSPAALGIATSSK